MTVPLPSRREKCMFTLKPVSHTVGDFLQMLMQEDKGIDRALITTIGNTHHVYSDENSKKNLKKNSRDIHSEITGNEIYTAT